VQRAWLRAPKTPRPFEQTTVLQPLMLLSIAMALMFSAAEAVEYGFSDMDVEDGGAAADPCSCSDSSVWRSTTGRACSAYRRTDAQQRVWVNKTRCIEESAVVHCQKSCGFCNDAGCETDGDGDYTPGPVNPMFLFIGIPCISVSFSLACLKAYCDRKHDTRVR
jgi:hypothetical protein